MLETLVVHDDVTELTSCVGCRSPGVWKDKEQGCSVSQGTSNAVTYVTSWLAYPPSAPRLCDRVNKLNFLHKGQGAKLQTQCRTSLHNLVFSVVLR